jgi:isoquinoline 1-oxidoreductase beta subunit
MKEDAMSFDIQIDRRSLLSSVAAVGGGLVLGFDIPFGPRDAHAVLTAGPEITAWVVIQPDDTVIIRVARPEMGQGNLTALPMLVAEELECDFSKVKTEYVPPEENIKRNRVWGDMFATGSRSIRGSQDYLRKAGATARTMLIAAAAKEWNVPASELTAEKGVITHKASGRTVTFGKVAEAAAKIEPPQEVKLKDPKDWKLAGKPQKRREVPDKVQGKPVYGIDVRLPNMLYASLVQCPVFKGRLKSVDDSKISGMKGIHKVVKLPDAVAVVADSWWRAKKAAEALQITWDDGGNGTVSSASIKDFVSSGLTAAEAGLGHKAGDVNAGLDKAKKRVEGEYFAPFQSHATLEPQNCTAHVTADKAEVWVSTQSGEGSLAAASQTLGMNPRNVMLHNMMVGGGYGRRGGTQDFVKYGVLIAKEVGQPVKTLWSREEDMRHDHYRPITMAKMTAGLDDFGMPIAWRVRLAGSSILSMIRPELIKNGVDSQMQEGFLPEDMPYDVENYLVDYALRIPHVPVSFWRCVNHNQNAFYKESFIDEMAHAAGADPYQYRRKMIGKHPHAAKFLGVLDAVAKKAEWDKPLPQGVHRGIALNSAYGTYVAGVVEMSLSDRGDIRVQRIVVATDPGYVVNPLTVEEQTEGSIVWALSATLFGEITVKNGAAEQGNFDTYQMLRLAQMPKVETIVMPSGGFWGGCGEPPVAVVAPALCNAIFAATGQRIRSLPLKNHQLRKA